LRGAIVKFAFAINVRHADDTFVRLGEANDVIGKVTRCADHQDVLVIDVVKKLIVRYQVAVIYNTNLIRGNVTPKRHVNDV